MTCPMAGDGHTRIYRHCLGMRGEFRVGNVIVMTIQDRLQPFEWNGELNR